MSFTKKSLKIQEKSKRIVEFIMTKNGKKYSLCELIYEVKISVCNQSIPFANIPYARFYCT